MKHKETMKRYNLPKKVKYCKECTISNQRPRITFDEYGVCSACNYAKFKQNKINWGEREKELMNLCDRFRRNDGRYDVIVPSSGGKDSAFVAHELKHKYGMNVLTVTWSPKNFQKPNTHWSLKCFRHTRKIHRKNYRLKSWEIHFNHLSMVKQIFRYNVR